MGVGRGWKGSPRLWVEEWVEGRLRGRGRSPPGTCPRGPRRGRLEHAAAERHCLWPRRSRCGAAAAGGAASHPHQPSSRQGLRFGAPCWSSRASLFRGCLGALRRGTCERLYLLPRKATSAWLSDSVIFSTRKEQRLLFSLEPIRAQLVNAGLETDLRLGSGGSGTLPWAIQCIGLGSG